jgi:hypothetical protein
MKKVVTLTESDIKKMIMEAVSLLKEYDNYIYNIYEDIMEDTNAYAIYNQFMEDKNNGVDRIKFNVIPKDQYLNLLTRYTASPETARIPENVVTYWFENIIVKNSCILDTLTSMAGHSSNFPGEELADATGMPELEDFDKGSKYLDEIGFYDWAKLPDGSDAISDYGLQPLFNIFSEYKPNSTPEETLLLINRALDVWHHRGDLASAFIEGGSRTCTEISMNESKKRKPDFFDKHGIKKETIPGNTVPSIGFSEKEQKWYGWSHRAIYGFGVGSKVKKGHAGYKGKEWTAKTLTDAKRMATDFAEAVSESKGRQTWRDNPLFTIGKYKGIEKVKIINEDPDYCLWLHQNTMESIANTPFSSKELALLDVSYYRKHKKFPIRSPYTPKYAKINGKYVCDMDKDELQYVYHNGSKEFKWLVKQEHMNRGWERRNWHELRGAPAFQSDDVGDEAWMRR